MKTLVEQISTIILDSNNESSNFYEDYLFIKKEYVQLIKKGYTKPRESILINSIEDTNVYKPLYNKSINSFF
jgi:hypothetical protein